MKLRAVHGAIMYGTIMNGKFIVIRRSTGEYAFIGGKVEENEKPLETFIREFKEETTYDITPHLPNAHIKEITIQHTDNNQYKLYVIKVSRNDFYQIANNIQHTREVTDVKLIPITKIANFLKTKGVDIAYNQIIEFLNNQEFNGVIKKCQKCMGKGCSSCNFGLIEVTIGQ